MAHMVVLGPVLDVQVSNFAFGNRWYRRIAWDRQRQPAQWVHRPYPILSDKTYLPYARSYGLFRRVANWTVAQMTEAPQPGSDYAGGRGSSMSAKWSGRERMVSAEIMAFGPPGRSMGWSAGRVRRARASATRGRTKTSFGAAGAAL